MGENTKFHTSPKEYFKHTKNVLLRGVEDERITPRDKFLIEQFINEIAAASQISPSRQFKYAYILVGNRDYHPAFEECTINDVYNAINSIKTATKSDGTPRYKANTIADKLRFLKRFFIWLVENGYSDIDIKKLNKIKTPRPDQSTITPDSILTEEEVRAIIEAATTSRDRALLSVLYEGGLRIGEIGNLRWGDVTFTDTGITITTKEKTGKPRFIPLFSSCAYFSQWKNDYPLPITDDSFVFLTLSGNKPLQYQAVAQRIQKIAVKAGITKHIKPHLFRHSRITHMVQQHLPESHIKILMWGDVNTDMLKTYLHLTNEDLVNELAKLNGIDLEPTKKEDTKKRGMKPVQCPRCATVNSPGMKYCGSCGSPLTHEGYLLSDDMENEIAAIMQDNPTFLLEMSAVMKELKKKHNLKIPGFGVE